MPDTFTLQHDLDKLARWSRELTTQVSRDMQEDVLRTVALEFLRRVIKRTPVDKGRARAGWTAYLDAQGQSIDGGGSDDTAKAQGRTEGSFREDFQGSEQLLEIINGVPYIVTLEFGRSQQAPAGFVRITVREMTGEAEKIGLKELEDRIVAADKRAGFRHGIQT